MAKEKIAIIGKGNVGGALGGRLGKTHEVKLAAREDMEAAAAWADVVFLAVPGDVTVAVASTLAPHLAGKIVVDCGNPVVWKDGPVWAPPPAGSLAEAIARAVPAARVVKGWNQFGAEFHADPLHAGAPAAQVFLAGDSAEAKQAVTAIATAAGFRPVDAGPLRNAGVLENLAVLWIHLATVGGRGRDFAFAMQERA